MVINQLSLQNKKGFYVGDSETDILSAIDNLIKGGAGQAVQNLNNKFNFSETTGLK